MSCGQISPTRDKAFLDDVNFCSIGKASALNVKGQWDSCNSIKVGGIKLSSRVCMVQKDTLRNLRQTSELSDNLNN